VAVFLAGRLASLSFTHTLARSYHAYPTATFGPDASQYTGFFSYVDDFMTKIDAIEKIRQQLSPHTRVSV
jgi:hypothetical protein